MELLCVQGTTLTCLDPSVTITPTPEVSASIFVDDKPALLSIFVTAATESGYTGFGTISGNTTCNFDINTGRPLVLSSASINLTLARGMTPYPLNPVVVKIDNPNQNSVFMD